MRNSTSTCAYKTELLFFSVWITPTLWKVTIQLKHSDTLGLLCFQKNWNYLHGNAKTRPSRINTKHTSKQCWVLSRSNRKISFKCQKVTDILVAKFYWLKIAIFSSFQEWANAMARRPSSVRPSVCKLLRKSLLLADKLPDRYQTWSTSEPASRVCSRSRSRSKVTWYAHFLGFLEWATPSLTVWLTCSILCLSVCSSTQNVKVTDFWSMVNFRIVESTESVGSRHELHVVANSVHIRRRRRDSVRQLSRVGVGGVYWALLKMTACCQYCLLIEI